MGASTGKAEIVRRLKAHGLPPEVCEGYFQVLRQFLTACATKPEFEVALRELLPADKISVHNNLIRDILRRAQTKREGAPDVPVLVPVKDKKTPAPKRAAGGTAPPNAAGTKAAAKAQRGASGEKRKRPEEDSAQSTAAPPPPAKGARRDKKIPAGAGGLSSPVLPRKPGPKDKAGVKRARTDALAASGQAPGAGPSAAQAMGGAPQKPTAPTTATAYDRMAFLPVRPGEMIDLELFLKLRQRVKRMVEDEEGLSGVRDDAVLLLSLALEMHTKNLMEGALACARIGRRPSLSSPGSQPPLSALDMHLSATNCGEMVTFGDDMAVSLERLALAIC